VSATARELFDAGKLNNAIEALGAELRERPTDLHRRTFLFELLCFAGNWDRADKQLDVLAGDDNLDRTRPLFGLRQSRRCKLEQRFCKQPEPDAPSSWRQAAMGKPESVGALAADRSPQRE
jgi:hypothetical protein